MNTWHRHTPSMRWGYAVIILLILAACTAGSDTVTSNGQWRVQSRSADNSEMMQVPAGCFQMGSTSNLGSENPMTKICFDKPFWIDKYEVTQAQFKKVGGTAVKAPAYSGENRPVEQVTWFEARDFCAKRGARLPTEAEWEYAARGPDGLTYPWGNTFDGGRVVAGRKETEGTANVGSITSGGSWVGAMDMSGNVWEWTNSQYLPYPYKADDGRETNSDKLTDRVLRGGSWYASDSLLRSTSRYGVKTDFFNPDAGFRCARSS